MNVFARTAVQLATTLAFMVHTSPPLSLVACCAVPVIGVATKRYGKLVWGLSKKMQNELAGAMRVAEEAFSSMLTVRSMAAEPLVCPTSGKPSKSTRASAGCKLLYAAESATRPSRTS